ncbi:alcohol dehydrogenase catalytic domain-containing protein [Candidatus Parcubacteria bacterium]|mgnify:CR=1 FL=1|jgi:threonine 3-dehydrogenase|nr:alcohol dehydrogenase catalytic domain-containing protein [Candidatus Parcubacteria bacterium]MBT3948801.1 alcohol dehydrogenase catalytic domain-containing protein [Candidatus Parcubacteria bacterium]
MKALIYDKTKGPWKDTQGFWLVDRPEPKLESGDEEYVIVKMRYAGFCGSDRGIWSRSSFGELILSTLEKENREERIIGHELLGEIVEMGDNVASKYDVKVGDVVSAESHITCGVCYQCVRGDKHVCADDVIIGIAQDGCFAEYAKLPASILWKTDTEKIDPRIAAMQEPFGNAVHATTQVDMKDKTVAVFGCGAIGSMSIIVAKGMGAKKIIGIDVNKENLKLAKEIGADEVIQIGGSVETQNIVSVQNAQNIASVQNRVKKPWESNEAAVQKIKELTNGIGVDVSLEMAGFNSSVNNAIQSVRRGGDVILFGLKSGDFVVENFELMIRNGVNIHSVIGRQVWDTWEMTKKLLEDESNGIQEKLKKYVLKNYEGSVVKFQDFDRDEFEKKMEQFPKLIFEF